MLRSKNFTLLSCLPSQRHKHFKRILNTGVIDHTENIFQVCLFQQDSVRANIKRKVIIRIRITLSSLQGYVQGSAPVSNMAKENQHMTIWPDRMTEQANQFAILSKCLLQGHSNVFSSSSSQKMTIVLGCPVDLTLDLHSKINYHDTLFLQNILVYKAFYTEEFRFL